MKHKGHTQPGHSTTRPTVYEIRLRMTYATLGQLGAAINMKHNEHIQPGHSTARLTVHEPRPRMTFATLGSAGCRDRHKQCDPDIRDLPPGVQLGATIATSNAIPTFGTFHQSTLINIGRIACSDSEYTYHC